MRQTITSTLTIPKCIMDDEDGFLYVHRKIEGIAEALKNEHGYPALRYVDHDLEDGFHFGFDGENLHYVVTYEVG